MSSVFLTIAVAMTIGAIQFVLWPTLMRRTDTPGARHRHMIFATLLMPVVAFGIYATTGNPQAASGDPTASGRAARQPTMTSPGDSSKGVASIASLVDGLAERLAREPGDARGWLLLAKSYKHLNRPVDFATAYGRARELGQTDPALEDYFTEVSAGSLPSSVVRGRVSISEEARSELGGDETVFIIARDASGSPAPLAVLKTTVQALPYTFEMSDANTMIKTAPLSSVDSIVLSAKISATGEALHTLPDLQATSAPVPMGHTGMIELGIGR